jgi:hypothetical protein
MGGDNDRPRPNGGRSLSLFRLKRTVLLLALFIGTLAAIHGWCGCVPAFTLTEGKFAFIRHPPIVDLRIVSDPEAASLAGLTVTKECERFAFFGHMRGRASKVAAADQRDGGWAFCITEPLKAKMRANDCVAYSFGISDDISFDLAVDAAGCTVRAFDHTIEGLPSTTDRTITHNIDYHHFGLGTSSDESPDLKSLSQIMLDNKDASIDYLKMDIEGSEWGILAELLQDPYDSSPLSKVEQICMEIHFNLNENTNAIEPREIATLKKLATHFDLYWRDHNELGVDVARDWVVYVSRV